jgi:hypothetical protein
VVNEDAIAQVRAESGADVPLVAEALYGLRTWRVLSDGAGEHLVGPQRGTVWPRGRGWMQARCDEGHAAPAPDCRCGIHAWHPRRRAARRVLASRFELPGIVEVRGRVEVHADGLRAERARPYAFVRLPNRNPFLIDRLSEAYGAEVLVLRRAEELLAVCRERGLGLDERVVDELLGPEAIEVRRLGLARKRRTDALRIAAAVAISATVAAAEIVVDRVT